jgi:hypothetical protein
MSERFPGILVAVAAKLGYGGRERLLRMGVVTSLTFDTRLAMTTVLPLIGGELVARGAQFVVWINGHALFGMAFDVGAVASFACHAFEGILAGASLEAGCMALEALEFAPEFLPVLLKDR